MANSYKKCIGGISMERKEIEGDKQGAEETPRRYGGSQT